MLPFLQDKHCLGVLEKYLLKVSNILINFRKEITGGVLPCHTYCACHYKDFWYVDTRSMSPSHCVNCFRAQQNIRTRNPKHISFQTETDKLQM